MKPIRFVVAAAAAALVAACATGPVSLTDTAAATPQLSTFTKLLGEAGLADQLKSGGPYTVFAPSDDAFKALPAKTMADLSGNKDLLKSVLSYHVLPQQLAAADIKTGSVDTVNGAKVALSKAGDFVTVEDAVASPASTTATNGVIYVIDRVLMPPKK